MSRPDVYNDKRWWQARAAALKRDGYRCTKCGRVGKLEVHHKVKLADDGERFALWNLRTLCVSCHLSMHVSPERMLWLKRIRMIENGNATIR